MTKISSLLRSFFNEDDGATMVEYALLVVVIALVAVVGAKTLGLGLQTKFNGISNCVANNGTGTGC